MNVRWLRRVVGAVLVALLTVACSSSTTPPPSATAPPPPGRFTRAQLRSIVLGPADAPKGTTYVASVSGFQNLGSFARDATELANLQDDGFEVGHFSLFFPSDHVTASGDTTPLKNDSVIVQGIAGLFRDADGAERSFERYVDDLRTRQLPDADDVPVEGLGDEGSGIRGHTPDGTHVHVYAWRVDNLILVVSGAGPIPSGDVRALANLVNGRTA